MYETDASEAELDAFGFKASDYGEKTVEVWPENMEVVRLFSMLGTQWRIGMSGPSGLDYTAVKSVLEMNGIKRKKQAEMLDLIGVMEKEALSVMHERK